MILLLADRRGGRGTTGEEEREGKFTSVSPGSRDDAATEQFAGVAVTMTVAVRIEDRVVIGDPFPLLRNSPPSRLLSRLPSVCHKKVWSHLYAMSLTFIDPCAIPSTLC
jgi:hypothetical protein